MVIYIDRTAGKLLFKMPDASGSGVFGDDNTADEQSHGAVFLYQTEDIQIVSDTQILTDLTMLNVFRADHHDHLNLVSKLKKHLKLTVTMKTRKHPGSMHVVQQLSAELHVEFIIEMRDPLFDLFRLKFQILIIVKPFFHG